MSSSPRVAVCSTARIIKTVSDCIKAAWKDRRQLQMSSSYSFKSIVEVPKNGLWYCSFKTTKTCSSCEKFKSQYAVIDWSELIQFKWYLTPTPATGPTSVLKLLPCEALLNSENPNLDQQQHISTYLRGAGNRRLFRSINYYLVYAIYAQVHPKLNILWYSIYHLWPSDINVFIIFAFPASLSGWLVEWINCLLLLWPRGEKIRNRETYNFHLCCIFRHWRALGRSMLLSWWITTMR